MNRLVILFALLFLFVEAETVTNAKEAPPSSNSKTVNVQTAGTLADYISDSEKYSLEDLTITGQLNGTDFRLIRDMAGCDYQRKSTDGKLKHLDLSGAVIAKGGEAYFYDIKGDGYTIETENEIPAHVFFGCKFEEVVLPGNVKKIGNYAFDGCTYLRDIELPESMESIESYAFSNSGLHSIKLKDGITVIGFGAFYMCEELNSINFPNTLTTIDSYAFNGCQALTDVNLPNSLTYLCDFAFAGCGGLTNVTIPRNVYAEKGMRYCNSPFPNCKNLKEIKVAPDNPYLEAIDGVLYLKGQKGIMQYPAGKEDMTFVIKDGITNLFGGVFAGCQYLKSIKIPKSITWINGGVFEGCTGLTEIELPKDVKFAGYGHIQGCTNVTKVISYIQEPEDVNTHAFEIEYGTAPTATLYVPYGTKLLYKQREGWNRFSDIREMEQESPVISFSDPEVKRICVANWDANGDGELSETEAATVTDLGDVFKGNKIITTFNELEYFTGLTAIATAAFDRCENLKSVVVPKNVISLGDCHPFTYCGHLNTIRVADGNKTYDSRGDCNAVIETATNKIVVGSCSTVIPNGVTSIGDAAFSNYDDLLSLTIPEGVKTIGRQAFWWCPNLKSIHIPASVTRIEKECFFGNQSMETMTVDAGNAVYDSRDNCNAIIETSTNTLKEGCYTTLIPNTVEAIGEAAFGARNGLKNVDIPKGITSIGVNAFYDCKNITSVNIPSSVKEINDYAFEDCERLATIHCHIDSPFDISDNVFQLNEGNQIYQKATLYVPYGNRFKYQRAAGWKNFKNIVEMKQKTLTLMVNRCEREYGDDNPVFTFTAEGDEFTGEPAITCEATKESPTGQYPITISKGNIEFDGKITFINAILSVTRVTVTITADDKTMTEGDDVPELTVTYTGFKNNETEDVLIQKPTIRAMGFSSSKPGTYPIYVTGGYAQNYIFNHVDGKLTIKKKEEVVEMWKHTLVINFRNGTQKKYPLKEMSDAQFSDENLIVKTKTSSISYRRSDILEFKFINAATDYDHVIFTPNSYTRSYGESNPKFEFTSDGASYTGLPTISCDATSTSPVGTYPIRISQGSVDNDNTTFLQGTLTVTKAPLVVTADSKKIVEGDEIPELTVTYDGFVNGETESMLLRKPVAATTATKGCEPGEYPIVVEGGLAENYEFDYQDGILTVEALMPVVRSHTLVMHLWNGHRERFVLSEQPLFVSSNDKLIVKTKSMSAVYLRSDIREFTFEDTAVDIDNASAADEITFRQMPNGDISISGLDDGATVRVHDLNGYTVYTSTAIAGSELVIPFVTRKSGVYLINIDNKRTIKIQKK